VYRGTLISRHTWFAKNNAAGGHMTRIRGALKEKRAAIAISGYHFSETGRCERRLRIPEQ
jgi:hypothetical protein